MSRIIIVLPRFLLYHTPLLVLKDNYFLEIGNISMLVFIFSSRTCSSKFLLIVARFSPPTFAGNPSCLIDIITLFSRPLANKSLPN